MPQRVRSRALPLEPHVGLLHCGSVASKAILPEKRLDILREVDRSGTWHGRVRERPCFPLDAPLFCYLDVIHASRRRAASISQFVAGREAPVPENSVELTGQENCIKRLRNQCYVPSPAADSFRERIFGPGESLASSVSESLFGCSPKELLVR